MKEFFSKTFWAQQFQDFRKLEGIMERMLSLLEEWGFVNVYGKDDDFVAADSLNKNIKLRPTLVGKRVSELYLDPLTARHLLDSLINFKDDKNNFSLLQMISHTLEMRPLLRMKVKEEDKIQEALIQNVSYLLKEEPDVFDLEYNEFLNSIKTTLFFSAWIDEKDEDFLLENYNIRPGEIRVKLGIADWLLYASEELAKVSSLSRETVKEINKLRVRVKHGAKEDLLTLLRLKGIGRVRARKLVNNNIKDLGDLKKVDLISLSQILGKIVAENVKEQVGEEVTKIKKGTRKGQLSMEKF